MENESKRELTLHYNCLFFRVYLKFQPLLLAVYFYWDKMYATPNQIDCFRMLIIPTVNVLILYKNEDTLIYLFVNIIIYIYLYS